MEWRPGAVRACSGPCGSINQGRAMARSSGEPIVSVAAMRAREAATWAAGISQESVILRAGVAVARVGLRWTRPNDPVLVLAGKGHNGDDAVVAEQHLAERDTELVRLGEASAAEAAREWLAAHRGHARAWVVDGMFGIGLNRPLDGEWAELVEAVNASGLKVLAVDVPSGLNADTGEAMGTAVRATVTVTLGAVKTGLLRTAAARYVGRLELAPDIGLLPGPPAGEAVWVTGREFAGFPPRRADDGHKGAFGHVAILAGSLGYHGAAVLAAQGALRARPGLVTVLTDERCYLPVASQLRAAMVRPWRGEEVGDGAFTSIVLGPGLASPGLPPGVRAEVVRLWRQSPAALVADASALDWLPAGPLENSAGPRIMTPHPGEAARLLQCSAAEVQADRMGALRRLAMRWPDADVAVVLKGRHTLVGGREGGVRVNSTGNPGMAQGGSGDVLAGYLGGLLAQPGLASDRREVIAYGVWRHGAAADVLEEAGRAWTIEDLVGGLAGDVG